MNSKKDKADKDYKALATYMLYTPNLDNAGHDKP